MISSIPVFMWSCLCFFLLCIESAAQTTQSVRPNIIIFLVDDMGWQDTSVPFWNKKTSQNEYYHTPSMERLAAEGAKFTNAYAAPVCTPSRISLITGMNAARHGVTNWTSIVKDKSTDASDDIFYGVNWNINGFSPAAGIPRTVWATPLPQILKEAGYFTIHAGKAHWAPLGTPGSSPYNAGFIVNIAGHAAGHPQTYYGSENYGNLPGKTTYHAVPDLTAYYGSEVFLTEALTREAIRAMEFPIANHQPFFLHLAHYALHAPIQGDPRFLQNYLAKGLDSIEAKYASLIEGMDKSLGDIMDYLEQKNQERNTIILFMSDNGGLSISPPRGGKQHTHNLPLREGKGSLHEGGIREPMIVKWPGLVKAGTVRHQYVIIEDFFPSILEMAGLDRYKTIQITDGRSFVPFLKDAERTDTLSSLIWHYPNKWGGGQGNAINYASAIRKGEWKLIYLMKEKKLELYNLSADITEKENLASRFPQKVRELAKELTDKLQERNALMPTYQSTGNKVPWPLQLLDEPKLQD